MLHGQVEHTYDNPKGVVHVNTGNSGGRNGFENGPVANFTAFRLTNTPCYSRLIIQNSTHLRFEQAHADTGTTLDSLDLVKRR